MINPDLSSLRRPKNPASKVHPCFTSKANEPCPSCDGFNVFIGHGTVRTCVDCVLSWGEGEGAELRAQKLTLDRQPQSKAAEASVIITEQSVQDNVNALPKDIRRRVKRGAVEVRAAQDLPERLAMLTGITPDEWEAAEEADEMGEEVVTG
jgi:hypothetical protein